MIQIQSSKQFTKAAERLQRERMRVRRAEPHLWEVNNTSKGTRYNVRFHRLDAGLFASCDCPAGLRHGRAPMMCKHVAAAVLVLRGVQEMRRQAAAVSDYDGND